MWPAESVVRPATESMSRFVSMDSKEKASRLHGHHGVDPLCACQSDEAAITVPAGSEPRWDADALLAHAWIRDHADFDLAAWLAEADGDANPCPDAAAARDAVAAGAREPPLEADDRWRAFFDHYLRRADQERRRA